MPKAKEALCIRQEPARARMLDDCRLPTREVAERPVADPGVLQLCAGRFRAAKLATGALDVALVVPWSAGDCMGITDAPAPFTEQDALLCVRLIRRETDRQLERFGSAPRQVQKWQEAIPLSVVVALSLKFHQRAPPVGHGG